MKRTKNCLSNLNVNEGITKSNPSLTRGGLQNVNCIINDITVQNFKPYDIIPKILA